MATDRSPYVAIADSIWDEPWTAQQRHMLVMLSVHMHRRWRSDRRLSLEDVAAEHHICHTDLCRITDTHRPHVAVQRLASLALVVSCRVTSEPLGVCVRWPKWAEYHRTHARSPGYPQPQPQKQPKIRESGVPSGRPRPAVEEENLALADTLIECLDGVPGARIPARARERWGREIERLRREVKGLGVREVEAGIRWALGPNNLGREYEVVIRSGASLREKWPRLVSAARRASAAGRRSVELEDALVSRALEGEG